jgi:hypothetical protein
MILGQRLGPTTTGFIGLDCGHVLADFRGGVIELGLAATGDEHVSALVDEPLGGRETNSATSSGDESCWR